jgi:hypothetical protein
VRLLRFLRGYGGEVPACADAYRKHLVWRTENGVDAIRQECVDKNLKLQWSDLPDGPRIAPHMPTVFNAGLSREGHVVQVENSGLINPEFILGTEQGAIGIETFTRNWIFMLEIRNKLHDDLSRERGIMIRTIQIRDMEQARAVCTHSAAAALVHGVDAGGRVMAGRNGYAEPQQHGLHAGDA